MHPDPFPHPQVSAGMGYAIPPTSHAPPLPSRSAGKIVAPASSPPDETFAQYLHRRSPLFKKDKWEGGVMSALSNPSHPTRVVGGPHVAVSVPSSPPTDPKVRQGLERSFAAVAFAAAAVQGVNAALREANAPRKSQPPPQAPPALEALPVATPPPVIAEAADAFSSSRPDSSEQAPPAMTAPPPAPAAAMRKPGFTYTPLPLPPVDLYPKTSQKKATRGVPSSLTPYARHNSYAHRRSTSSSPSRPDASEQRAPSLTRFARATAAPSSPYSSSAVSSPPSPYSRALEALEQQRAAPASPYSRALESVPASPTSQPTEARESTPPPMTARQSMGGGVTPAPTYSPAPRMAGTSKSTPPRRGQGGYFAQARAAEGLSLSSVVEEHAPSLEEREEQEAQEEVILHVSTITLLVSTTILVVSAQTFAPQEYKAEGRRAREEEDMVEEESHIEAAMSCVET